MRSQAGKARKYKEFSDRLRQLRTTVGLVDWRRFSTTLTQSLQESTTLQAEVDEMRSAVAVHDEQLQTLEASVDQLQQQTRQANALATSVREKIAQSESLRRSQLARSDELTDETQRLEKQLLAMSTRAGSSQQMVDETTEQLELSESQYTELESRVRQQQAELDLAQAALSQCRSDLENCREQHTQAFHDATQFEHRIQTVESQHQAAATTGERLHLEVEKTQTAATESSTRLAVVVDQGRQDESASDEAHQNLLAAQDRLRQHRAQLAKSQVVLAELKGRLSGAKERSLVLEELERQLDGLSAGTKEVLRLAKAEPNGPFGRVRGVVADLLHVDADTASIVEIALGERANCLVIEQVDARMVELTEDKWPGRTSFLRLDVPHPASAVDRIDLSGEPGIIGRADQFVEIAPDLAPLARRLLARHWFVDSLQTAFRLSTGVGRGLNFVTAVGEVLAADGTLIVGPRQSSTGLLSRRSELRALVDEIREMQSKIKFQTDACGELELAIQRDEHSIAELTTHQEKTARVANETRMKVASARERLERTQAELAAAQLNLQNWNDESTHAAEELADLRSQLAQRRLQQTQFQKQLTLRTEQAARLEQQVADQQPSLTDSRVALARSEQRRDGLRHQMEQLRRDHQEHDRALEETRQRTIDCRTQQAFLRQSVLDLTSELAELYHEKERLTAELESWNTRGEELRKQRTTSNRAAEGLRSQLLEKQTRLQQLELKQQQREQQRHEIAARLAEDYHLDLALLAATEPPVELSDRAATEEEIRKLREQLSSVGPVNLEALDRAGNHRRAAHLARQAIPRPPHRQGPPRATSGEHQPRKPQHLPRDAGSGPRPFPGTLPRPVRRRRGRHHHRGKRNRQCWNAASKSSPAPRASSLAASRCSRGGERTLTCVALLLAIFRSRPSPFCVLDEVDAALDEANIDRFIEVLKQFMASTQFIVVTHSQKTMTCCRHDLRHDDAGIGRLQAGFGAIRGRQRGRPNPLSRNTLRER